MPMITLKNICKTFYTGSGTKEALKNISMEINSGDLVVIGGENGSGKSVLMSVIAGLEEADRGTLTCTSRVGLVFQEADTQILGETVEEDVAYGPKNLGMTKTAVQEAVAKALNTVGLQEKARYPARFLSGGEKRRLAVACMIAMDFPVIIFDEPYANLDFGGVKQVNALIQELKSQGKTIVILTHETEKCLGLANRFIVLFWGEKVFDGTPEEGLQTNLEQWNIRNPLVSYTTLKDLVW